MNNVICSAIHTRTVIQFDYDGGMRTVEPYCHGTSTAGNEVLRGFQTSGYSQSEKPQGWKLFDVGKISNLSQTSDRFPDNRAGYNPEDPGMVQIDCQV